MEIQKCEKKLGKRKSAENIHEERRRGEDRETWERESQRTLLLPTCHQEWKKSQAASATSLRSRLALLDKTDFPAPNNRYEEGSFSFLSSPLVLFDFWGSLFQFPLFFFFLFLHTTFSNDFSWSVSGYAFLLSFLPREKANTQSREYRTIPLSIDALFKTITREISKPILRQTFKLSMNRHSTTHAKKARTIKRIHAIIRLL